MRLFLSQEFLTPIAVCSQIEERIIMLIRVVEQAFEMFSKKRSKKCHSVRAVAKVVLGCDIPLKTSCQQQLQRSNYLSLKYCTICGTYCTLFQRQVIRPLYDSGIEVYDSELMMFYDYFWQPLFFAPNIFASRPQMFINRQRYIFSKCMVMYFAPTCAQN